jgi:hypothetical protein
MEHPIHAVAVSIRIGKNIQSSDLPHLPLIRTKFDMYSLPEQVEPAYPIPVEIVNSSSGKM